METFKVISYPIASLWFAGVLRWDVLTDYKKWLQDIPVKHTGEAILRIALLSVTFVLLLWPKLYSNVWQWHSLMVILVDAGLIFSVWWELFDGWYNKIRGQKWRFNGSVDEDDGMLDRFLYNIGDTAETILKWGLILAFLLKYIFI